MRHPSSVASSLRIGSLLVAVLAFATSSRAADSCKPDGQSCRTSQSCCGRVCFGSDPPGKRPAGACCTPTTCATAGANCGSIRNGTCPDMLSCGTCTAPAFCGASQPNVCGTSTTSTSTSTTTSSTTSTIFYPQSTALRRTLTDELDAFANNCVSIYLDTTESECGCEEDCCHVPFLCCNGENHHQGLARTPPLSDGSVYFFLSHSGVNDDSDRGKLMQFRYPPESVEDGHVTGAGVTAPMEQQPLIIPDEQHPSAITFLPDVNHSDAGYLFVAEEYDVKRVVVYFWQPGQDLQPIGDLTGATPKPSHVLVDKVDDYYWVVILDDTNKVASAFKGYYRDVFPRSTPGGFNVFAFQPVQNFSFSVELGSQAQLVRDGVGNWYVLGYYSPDDDGMGQDYVEVFPIQFFDDGVAMGGEISWGPVPFFFPGGQTSFTNTGTHYVDHDGRLLISTSDRWSHDQGGTYSWESRVDECAPAH